MVRENIHHTHTMSTCINVILLLSFLRPFIVGENDSNEEELTVYLYSGQSQELLG